MKVFIHIGTDKTGSTAIQGALFHAAERLRKIGVHYPTLGTRLEHHEYLVDEILEPGPTPRWNDLIEYIEAEQPDTIILSSEKFCKLKPEQISRIKELLKGADIEIICYLRPADQYLESALLQRLKSARSRNQFQWMYLLAKWVPSAVNPAVYLAALKPLKIFRWIKYFSGKNLHLRPYDKQCWIGNDLIVDFLHVCSIDSGYVDIPAKNPVRNATPDIYCVYISHILKATGNQDLAFYFSEFMARENANKIRHPVTRWTQRAYCRFLSGLFLMVSGNKGNGFVMPAPPIDRSCFSPSFRDIERTAPFVLVDFFVKHRGKALAYKKPPHSH